MKPSFFAVVVRAMPLIFLLFSGPTLFAANPKVVAEVKEGKLKGVGALIGQAKKKNPNANPTRVRVPSRIR